MSGPGLLPGPRSGIVALLQLWTVLMFLAPDITEGLEDRAVQSWFHPSLAAAIGRNCPAFHQLKHSGQQVPHFAGAAH